ncbi:unnamed protein product [Heterobilharzia americana]|nr:unnamed protein product [Heterobilharzia americana]
MPKVTHNFLEFLQPDTRLFNTVLVPVPPGDESLQALRVVASTILISLHSIGRYLELTETKPPNKLERLRQAGVPKEYQPSINLHTLGSGLRGMGRRRESVVSLRSRYRISRATSIQDAVLDTDGGVVMINPDVNIDDQNAKNQVSLAKMNTNTIKQRLKQIKFPKLPFNFGRHMRSTSGQSRAEEVQIIPEKFNNLKQEKDEPDSEIADCRQFCSPKFKLKRNNNNRIYVGADVDYDDADDDDLDEEDDETENSDAMDSEEDIALSDEDSVSEDSQLANKMSTLYQYSKYPAFRRSTYHGVHESSGCEQAIQSSPLSSGSVLRTPHYKRYSHSESDINKRMTALSSSCDLIGHEQKKQSETPLKLLKKSIRESYQAISKSKLSLQLTSVEKITPQLTNRLLNPSVNDRQINLQTVTLEELLYGSRVVSASRSGSIRGGSVSHIEKGNNTAGKTMSTTSDSNYILEINDQPILLDYLNNKAIYERLQQLFKHYTQQSIMNSVLFYTEYNNPINTFTTNSVIDTLSQSVNSEFNTPIIHDYGLYELLQHVYIPEIILSRSQKLTEKLRRKQMYSLIQLDRVRRELFILNDTKNDGNYELKQQKTIYSSFILF